MKNKIELSESFRKFIEARELTKTLIKPEFYEAIIDFSYGQMVQINNAFSNVKKETPLKENPYYLKGIIDGYHIQEPIDSDDFVPSELNGVQADNIYPILDLTSIPDVNIIENLIALTEDQVNKNG